MVLNLGMLAAKEPGAFAEISSIADAKNICTDTITIDGKEVELWCYDDDLSRLFHDNGIGVGASTNVEHRFMVGDDYEPVGLTYGDYIETVELTQNGMTYEVPVYCAFNGTGADYAFALSKVREKQGDKAIVAEESERMDKTIKYDFSFGEEEFTVSINTYLNNGNMHIGLTTMEDGYPEPFGDLTVNLDETLPPYHAYVDTNNLPGAEVLIAKAGIGEPTGDFRISGYCSFPLYRFHKEKLKEYCQYGVAAYEATLAAPVKRRAR